MPIVAQRSLYHGWLPSNPKVHEEFLRIHVAPYSPNAPVRAPRPVAATKALDDLVKEFFATINASTVMVSLFNLMFRQVNKLNKWAPSNPEYAPQTLEQLEQSLTSAISGPPNVYVVTQEEDPNTPIGEPVGIPIYLVLDLLINTDAAHDLFRMSEFNIPMQKLLDGWGDYLQSDGSNSTLTTDTTGWFGTYGLEVLQQGLKGLSFEHTYGVDPLKAQDTYQSWDQFFIRPIQNFAQLRPIFLPDLYTAVHNACESTTFRTAKNVQLDDTFWLKTQNYSLWDMFGGAANNTLTEYASQFVGGSVYQAFLAPWDYHHWHSPIKGTVKDFATIAGTYYAALPDDGAPKGDSQLREGDPHGAFMRSQPWLNVSAARGVLIIEPEETSPIALIGFIAIGMVEVSTIDFDKDTIKKGALLEVGTHMGMFHYGGSSYSLVMALKPGNEVLFQDEDDQDVDVGQHRWVNSIIGRVVPSPKNT